jgi:hypothetical protein
MIKREIDALPRNSKYLEFSPSLELIRSGLEKLCASLHITEKEKRFSITFVVNSVSEHNTLLESKDLAVFF